MKNDIIFEKIHSNKNRISFFIGIVCVVILLITLVLTNSFAKYRSTASVPIVDSEVNYVRPDLDVVALYIDGVQASELDSSKNYTLDTNNSICTYKDGSSIDNLTLNYDSETGSLSINPFTTRGTKCYLYFEEAELIKDTLLSYYPTVLTRTDFSTTVTNTTTGTIYKSADESQYDNDGEVYYFAGNPTDNWVSFAGYYWRIIRINGDGTIRIIYSGTSIVTTGTETQITTSRFNSLSNNNMYVGYMYTSGEVHGVVISSTIKEVLESWYSANIANTGYSNYIDTNAGFCNDRTPYSGTGTGTSTTYYGAYNRLSTNKIPTFGCSDESNDVFTVGSSNKGNKALTYPVGLITADEVAYAGGVYGTNNSSYYLYTNQYYWTMSPYNYNGETAYEYLVDASGFLNYNGVNRPGVDISRGVRPVINLKATTTISSGNGTASSPFVIN